MEALLTFVVTLLALSFLIFLHELGHLLAALFVGARVISFNMGLGSCLCSFTAFDIKWRINLIPIGGAVEIAGMQPGKYHEKGGFYSVSPWRRILIVIAGPLANILTALVCFSFVFSSGGRIRSFLEQTQHIGFVQPSGPFYEAGLRAGDRITSYDHKPVSGFQDHLLTALLKKSSTTVAGEKFRWNRRDEPVSPKAAFSYNPEVFSQAIKPRYYREKSLYSFGVSAPASFLLAKSDLLPEGKQQSPWQIHPEDQLVWVNGYRIFSLMHLETVLNSDVVFAVVERKEQRLGLKLSCKTSDELEFHIAHREQITDWILDHPGEKPYQEVKTLPYLFSSDATVIEEIGSWNKESAGVQAKGGLLPGDRILSINGNAVQSRADVLSAIQNPSALIICYRPQEANPLLQKLTVSEADLMLHSIFSSEAIDSLALAMEPGTAGDFVRLAPRRVRSNEELFPDLLKEHRKTIASKRDDSEKAMDHRLLLQWQNTKVLGLQLRDLQVRELKSPFAQLNKLLKENALTFRALITGALSPKWLSGPVGMFSTVYKSQKVGVNEQVYWLGFLSVGLAFFNLLPIPVLDGGHLLFNMIALVTRKKLNPVWLERFTLPFALMLISLILYATYWDVYRILG